MYFGKNYTPIESQLKPMRKNLKTYLTATVFLLFIHNNIQAQTAFKDVTDEAGIKHQFDVFEGFLGGSACVFDIMYKKEEYGSC